ncbi:UDP-glycosyltransferase 86A1-like [Chenopodium quinoa]|uniref:Glycosyltransferase n=1 Tax=Chenopodium quinoa TaxID=63459 RepID=A0A803L7H3_CHEQI|nr:UDP-glycosyltransferase 86A1-like [Chenopodium quinoa]
MEAPNSDKKVHHAIVLPLPLQGHLNPAVNFSLKLASSKNFTITFLTFEFLHQQITQACPRDNSDDIFSRARTGLDIRYRAIPDGLPLEFDRAGKGDEFVGWCLHGGMFDLMDKEIEKLVLNSNPKVDVLIIDSFYPWASKIAKKFGLRSASFWTEPALVFNLYYHIHLLKQHGHFDCPDIRKDPIDYIPGVDSIDPQDLMSYLHDKDISTNIHNSIFQSFQEIRLADYVLCNTVEELESNTILALQDIMPIFAIGPIFQSESLENIVSTSLWAKSNCLEWLGTKPNCSVLYVSFGSLANFTQNDVVEIAYGLMESNVDFIWVLRPRTVLHESNHLLPMGFEDLVCGRGMVVPWTNQIAVLSHPAIGGFLTHCGWNSVLDSMWYEVPMLCFPVFSDQFPNQKLVVDDWKVGINLCKEKPLRKEITAQIKSFMIQHKGNELRKHISVLRKLLGNALEDGGSSSKNLDLFIEHLDQ